MSLSIFSPFLRNGLVSGLARDALLAFEPETAHRMTIEALKGGLVPRAEGPDAPELAVRFCGLDFTNPVGMAAGFDKNGEVCGALAAMGFGFVEAGTLTPRPQSGNPQPRMFRIGKKGGVINRLGFNNGGHAAALARLQGLRLPVPMGINVGANKDSQDFVADYVAGVKAFAGIASYLTVNISSPNTPGLRDLQSEEALRHLLGEVLAARAGAKRRVPVLLKIAPDLDEAGLDGIAAIVLATDLDGLIVSNTTISRETVSGLEHSGETGGLSGAPLFDLSTQKLAQMRLRLGPDFPLIGVGGIHSAKSAIAKFEAGANLIQLYTGLVFGGFGLLEDIKHGLVVAARAAGGSVSALSNRNVGDWAAGKARIED